MAASKTPSFPHLLYVYPWMPFRRRVIIHREKGIHDAVEIGQSMAILNYLEDMCAAGAMELPGAREGDAALSQARPGGRQDHAEGGPRAAGRTHQCFALMATRGAAVNVADVVLYQFLEFVDDCYGVDITVGSGEVVTNVYGLQVKDSFPMLVEFYTEFKKRDSAKRTEGAGEKPPAWALAVMTKWADGVL
ncbi:uncharacterized protein PpBr36_09251 [Pyricularia pennisetigena]|uniref:uncharacterized protein n=1 Tax=Pyricularia pennisetigena TaxID=1578925 RepID=UPI001152ED19|nr:uncharacterized protein PpBr36_09251 [Pyricularia pennisetigena]TLS22121.1 hypothetical protein PpBr36_09251 [Pyricularia pennisetigena]